MRFLAAAVLQAYFLGSYSARKLGMQTTGNAGGAHNLVIAPGDDDLDGLLRRMSAGCSSPSSSGKASTPVTGNYSRGRRRFLDRGRRDCISGRGDHDRRQPEADVRDIVAIGRDVDRRGSTA